MRGPYPYELQSQYPHLSKAEAEIWSRFITAYPDAFKQCWYDVEVGQCRPSTEELKPEWEQNRAYLGKYKIDVVAENDEFWCVIEVKKEATTKAMGEVWLYDELFRAEWNPKKPVLNYIVTDTEMPNIRAICEKEGVQLYVVPSLPIGTEDTLPIPTEQPNQAISI